MSGRLFRFLFVAAVLALGAIYAFARHARRASMFFPSRYPEGAWETHATDHWYHASDGVKLHGWHFPATDPQAPLMVWIHGNAGNITGRAPTAAAIAERGVAVFLAEFRGYGRSEGRPTEEGLYLDALAAHDYASRLSPAVVMYGESLGGPFAAYVAKERKVRAVVIENSFPSLRELGNTLYAPLPLGWTAPRAMATRRWLNEAGVPVLVMHGREDQVIPFELGVSLYERLTVPKEMLVSETAGHSGIPSTEGQRYYDTVVRFIGTHGR